MIKPIIENIEQVLTGLADGTLNRHEAVAWGKAVYQQYGAASSLRPEFKTDIKHFTNFWAVCVGALLHEGCNANGEPYFYRDHDFREWLAVLRREDAIRPANATIWSIRMHQVLWRDPLLAVCFEMTTEEITQRTGISEVRGLDNLDYYKNFFFDTTWGNQYVLESYPREQSTQQVLCLDVNAPDRWGSIRRFLHIIDIPEEKLTWVSPTIQ